MSFYVLDTAFRILSTGGVTARRVVVRASDGNGPGCSLPTAANADGFLGVTTHGQPRQNRHVAVRRLGVAECIAAAPITAGQRVCIADNQGRVRAIPHPRFTSGTVASNNAIVIEWLQPELFHAALQIDIHLAETSITFGWAFNNGHLRLTPAGNGDEITETANSLIAAVEADAALSRLIRITHAAGSDGTGEVLAGLLTAGNLADLVNPIGIADAAAEAADAVVPVLLTH